MQKKRWRMKDCDKKMFEKHLWMHSVSLVSFDLCKNGQHCLYNCIYFCLHFYFSPLLRNECIFESIWRVEQQLVTKNTSDFVYYSLSRRLPNFSIVAVSEPRRENVTNKEFWPKYLRSWILSSGVAIKPQTNKIVQLRSRTIRYMTRKEWFIVDKHSSLCN